MTGNRTLSSAGLLAALFVVGFLLMGFEMLGSRYLNPYFGSGITTWASLISVVLLAMMMGYYTGGHLADRRPAIDLLSGCIFLAGIFIGTVPLIADAMMSALLTSLGDGFVSVLLASLSISFIPIALLSACSPSAVRLLLKDLKTGGATTGLVYAISTGGNVFGTLATTFLFIPHFGTRAITYAFAAVLILLAIPLYSTRYKLVRNLTATAAAFAVALFASGGGLEARAGEIGSIAKINAFYPEGARFFGERLFYTEMAADRLMTWDSGSPALFWSEPGCGPTSVSRYKDTGFMVLCHLGKKVVEIDASGRKVSEILGLSAAEPFQDPNDSDSDGAGGVFISDSGDFSVFAKPTGKLFHILPDGQVVKLAEGLHYTNGVAWEAKSGTILLSEHLAQRVLKYHLEADGSATQSGVFLDLKDYFDVAQFGFPETGPDGLSIGPDGAVYIAIYGAGMVLRRTEDGQVLKVPVRTQYVCKATASPTKVAVVGAFIHDVFPFPGSVDISTLADFTGQP